MPARSIVSHYNQPLENHFPLIPEEHADGGHGPVSLPIQAGEIVRLLPAYQDPGDENVVLIAVDDESKGRVLVQLQVDLPIRPTQIVRSYMIDRARRGTS